MLAPDLCDTTLGSLVFPAKADTAPEELGKKHGAGKHVAATQTLLDLAQLLPKPPAGELAKERTMFSAGTKVLADVGHEAKTPGVVLVAEGGLILAVLVPDKKGRRVDEGMACFHDAKVDIEIAAARKGAPGIEGLIKTPKGGQRIAAEGHVGAGAKDTCTGRIKQITGKAPAIAAQIETTPETAAFLKKNLCAGVEFPGEDKAGESGGVGVFSQRRLKSPHPPRIDNDIVVEIGDPGGGGLLPGVVAGKVETRARLDGVANSGIAADNIGGFSIGRRVVHHENLNGMMNRQSPERIEAAGKKVGMIARANSDGEGERRKRGWRKLKLVNDGILNEPGAEFLRDPLAKHIGS